MEFKRDLTSPNCVLRTIVAFANSAVGCSLSGLRVVGSPSPLADEEQLASLIGDRIEPRLAPDIAIVPWRRTQLLVVNVQLTRREQIEPLLSEFDRHADSLRDAFAHVDGVVGTPITYDTAALRRELGIT